MAVSKPAPYAKDIAADPALLLEVVGAVGAGHITAQRLDDEDDPSAVTFGICEGNGRITVDEAACVVQTLIHEAIHRVRPRWSERRVIQAEQRVFCALTRDQVEAIHRLYLSVRYARRAAKTI